MEFQEEFHPVLKSLDSGSVADSVSDVNVGLTLPKFFIQHTLSCNSVNLLKSLFLKLNETSCDLLVNSICKRYTHIFLNGYRYNSSVKNFTESEIIYAKWDVNLYGEPPNTLINSFHPNANNQPLKVHYYASVSHNVGDTPINLLLYLGFCLIQKRIDLEVQLKSGMQTSLND